MIKIFEGKNPAERNKIIALLVLGVMTFLAIINLVYSNYPSRKTSVTVKVSPTPTASPKISVEAAALPNQEEVNFDYTTTPVVYNVNSFYAPDAGRNIFAFYEPPAPTPYVTPSPVFKPATPPPTPIPTPTPPLLVAFVSPQSVYAGSKTFRLEVNGDKFTPDSVILFSGNQLPTTFVSPQKLFADVPSNFINGQGSATIMVNTPDGKLYSNQFILNIQEPPRPPLQYIGMIGRKRANNDTAYFQEQGKNTPFGARLNDVVAGRFRVTSISPSEVIFEDVTLGFRHKLALFRPAPGQAAGGQGAPNNGNPNVIYNPINPNVPNYNIPPQGGFPGIPSSIPLYVPPQPTPTPNDEDDDGNN